MKSPGGGWSARAQGCWEGDLRSRIKTQRPLPGAARPSFVESNTRNVLLWFRTLGKKKWKCLTKAGAGLSEGDMGVGSLGRRGGEQAAFLISVFAVTLRAP